MKIERWEFWGGVRGRQVEFTGKSAREEGTAQRNLEIHRVDPSIVQLRTLMSTYYEETTQDQVKNYLYKLEGKTTELIKDWE